MFLVQVDKTSFEFHWQAIIIELYNKVIIFNSHVNLVGAHLSNTLNKYTSHVSDAFKDNMDYVNTIYIFDIVYKFKHVNNNHKLLRNEIYK